MINKITQVIRYDRLLTSTCMLAVASSLSMAVAAQTAEEQDKDIEKIAVVGSQIKGAEISEALAVSQLSAEDIATMGVDSGDELLQLIPENGQNFFNEAGNISGGVNAARGDVGAFNLRNIGTGNTLVLLNGRRMVNSAAYQTEVVGGSFVPVNTVNSQTIPVFGAKRVEVLRDGASAIYGADAVAGVVNTVTPTDFVGFDVRVKWQEYENLPRNDQTLSMHWGKDINDGKTNIGVIFNYYQRDRVNSQDDPRWSNADLTDRLSPDSPWYGHSEFDSTSANSLYGQFDIMDRVAASNPLRTEGLVDGSGEFETFPSGDARCVWELGNGLCAAPDGQGTERYNMNLDRDLTSELERTNVFININHTFENGWEAFTEIMGYKSDTNLRRHPTASFSSSKLIVAADNYYNPFGPCGSPNRLDNPAVMEGVPCEGLALEIDNYRFAELPRIVDNSGETYRFLQGLRGYLGNWDWETAVSYSKGTKDDVTHNRVSNTLMQEALNDTTAAAYNPFAVGVDSNIERALIDVYRKSESELTTFDFKVSNADLFELPAGAVGFVAGVEWREESFKDDRDPRLDGTIQFIDDDGDTYPFVSDVVNSSPTPDNKGSRNVSSLFAEFQIPILDNLDLQLAARYENFSDVGDTTVGKVAFGYRPFEPVLLRGSWSEAFRAPNLVTINEEIVARTQTRTDYACLYAAENGGDPDQDALDCNYSLQRIAQGSEDLQPEKSDNTSVGIVVEPLEGLAITLDYWSIKKKDTIGLLGEENHSLLDLLYRLEQGTANCEGATFNSAVNRGDIDPDEAAFYNAAGICAAGQINYIDDRYANLDTRTVSGHDLGVYYTLRSDFGRFKLDYNASFLDKFEQEAGGVAQQLVQAQADGILPAHFPVMGFDDLVRRNGNQKEKHSLRMTWRKDAYGASLSAYRIGSFYQAELTLEDGTRYNIPAMTTFDATVDYTAQIHEVDTRFRLGVKNLTDERAPLAASSFGYFEDAHQDYGRYFYLDVRASF
ncbi:TonB-dependent receptor domain-containing protein [Planctobacterium marinum]|uniref:TonB-dependent receptor domain-containing protein n=1 Tax=Planctobacterium marinum TaxID=1631968 RepID=UPI001E4B9288|nr:TonB-dependent receptor [Planctobacterium marinum]MCC2604850.1 TonB-dependent receptor [Planctobacterium marinum]